MRPASLIKVPPACYSSESNLRRVAARAAEVAYQIHADDFQLITPLEAVFSKEPYLGAVATGHLRYLGCEFDSPIDVRMYDNVAMIHEHSGAKRASRRADVLSAIKFVGLDIPPGTKVGGLVSACVA